MKAMTLVGTRRGTDGVWVNAIAMHEGAFRVDLENGMRKLGLRCRAAACGLPRGKPPVGDRLESENDALHRHLVVVRQPVAYRLPDSLMDPVMLEAEQAVFAANHWLSQVRSADAETIRLVAHLRDVVEMLRDRLQVVK